MKHLTRTFSLIFAALLLTSAALIAQTPPPAPAANQASAPQDPAMELVKQARKLNSEGKQDEAIELYKKAVDASPKLVEAFLGAGAAFDLKGDYAQARHHFQRAIELAATPEVKAQALRSMAMSYAFEGKGKEAAKYEQQVFDADMAKQDFTGAAEVANEQARLSLESGDLNDAEKWYRLGYNTALRKTDMKPEEKDLWDFRWEHALARIAARRGQKAEAEKHVAAAKALLDKGGNPQQAQFYPYLTGYVAFYGGDYRTAIAELLKGNQRDPFILSLLAQSYEKTGDTAQAMDLYRKIMATNIHNPTGAFSRPLARKKLASAPKG